MDDCDRTGEGGEEISSSSSDNGDIGRQGLLKTSSSFGKTGLPEKKKQQQKKKNLDNNIRNIQINPSTPRSDSHVTSPYNFHPLSSKQVMRILKFIR